MKVTYLPSSALPSHPITARELFDLGVPGRMLYWKRAHIDAARYGEVWEWQEERYGPKLQHTTSSAWFDSDCINKPLDEMAFEIF